MAEDREGEIEWYSADPRGIIDLGEVHVPQRFRRYLRHHPFTVRFNTAFGSVMKGCQDRESTWISDEMIESYVNLHRLGYAHSVEAWRGDELVGGLYGVALRGAFFGESMFHRETNASKVCLHYLVEHLREKQYFLLDCQMVTPVTEQFGAILVPRTEYLDRLREALTRPCTF